jgi:hypothetical protein
MDHIEVIKLNNQINESHTKHYENSETGLIDPKESPNGNLIYHLYSNGEITCQKGGWAYLQRSEFTFKNQINGIEILNFNFTIDYSGDSYVILTKEECIEYRYKMEELYNNLFK